MKIENITTFELVKTYLHTTYPRTDTLVVDLEDVSHYEDAYTLMNLLEKHLGKMPTYARESGWLIVEMNRVAAINICNKFDTGFTRMFVFHGGECIHENF